MKEKAGEEYNILSKATELQINNYITNSIKKHLYKEIILFVHSEEGKHLNFIHGDEKYIKYVNFFTEKMYKYVETLLKKLNGPEVLDIRV